MKLPMIALVGLLTMTLAGCAHRIHPNPVIVSAAPATAYIVQATPKFTLNLSSQGTSKDATHVVALPGQGPSFTTIPLPKGSRIVMAPTNSNCSVFMYSDSEWKESSDGTAILPGTKGLEVIIPRHLYGAEQNDQTPRVDFTYKVEEKQKNGHWRTIAEFSSGY